MENTLKLILANDGCMIRSIIRSKSTSMPLSYAGADTSVWVQESEEERLEIFDKETGKQITSHPLCKEKGKTVSNMAHHRVRNVPREDME